MAAYEEELTAVVFAHPDAEEGMTAFLEKRRPVFQDETASLEGKGP